MNRVSVAEVKRIAEEYRLKPCKVRGTSVVNIRKHRSPNQEDISWEEFEELLKQKGLAVYKAENSDFLKIRKSKI